MKPAIPLLVASTNKKKLAELKELLNHLPFDIKSLNDFPGIQVVEENGKSFEENAILKAKGYSLQTGLMTLAEDSGLCCDALEGAPGIYSARFSREGATDEENNQKLLRLLEKVPDNCRSAHYVSFVAIADKERLIGTAEGQVHGYIAKAPAGSNGFGYDPLFFFAEFKKTFAEVEPVLKQKVSHRANALAKTKRILEKLVHTA